MDLSYKEVDYLSKDEPNVWDRFSFLSNNIEKSMKDKKSDKSEEETITCEYQFLEICTQFQISMQNEDPESSAFWLQQLFYYTSLNIISDSIPPFTVPDIIFIIANENEKFSLETRKYALDVVYNFLDGILDISDYFVQCNAVSLFSVFILDDDNLCPLHLPALKCLKKIAGHCEDCQACVCQNLNFKFIDKWLAELAESKIVNEIHIEIFSIFKNISKFLLDYPTYDEDGVDNEEEINLVTVCFNSFLSFMDYSDELLRISLLGIGNIMNFQSRSDWYKIYENSQLSENLPRYLKYGDFTIIQTSLLVIASIYRQKQNTPSPNFRQIVGLLHHNDEENESSSSSVRYYAAVAINEIIKDDAEFIHLIIKCDYLIIIHEIYDKSSYDVKQQISISLNEIAINGYPEDKVQIIQNDFLKYFIEMVDNGDDEQILQTIRALDVLFSGNYKKNCYEWFRNSPNYTNIFNLSEYPGDEVRNRAIDFLNEFFPISPTSPY